MPRFVIHKHDASRLHHDEDPGQALRDGHLSFWLDGHKVRSGLTIEDVVASG